MTMGRRTRLERFGHIWDDHADRVSAYAARRVSVADRDDIVAETFAVAWRRIAEIPIGAELPWLLRTASLVIANQRRGELRHARLAARVSTLSRPEVDQPGDEVSLRLAVQRALARLSEPDREVLRLIEWEHLSTDEAAQVSGCSAPAFRVRLHRARRRFERTWRQEHERMEDYGYAVVAQRGT